MKYLIVTWLVLMPVYGFAQESYTYKMPDVRNDYCGVHINYQYCKCAFHGDYCEAVGLDKYGARSRVMGEFRTWVGDQIESMARNCLDEGNRWSTSNRTCTVLEVQERVINQSASLEEEYNLPVMQGVPEPVNTTYYGKISTADGEVFVYQWAFKRWVKALPGMPVYNGDFVNTRNGETRIIYNGEFGDDIMNLAPETILETGRYIEEQPREGGVSLLGIMREGAIEIYNEAREAYEAEAPVPTWYRQLHTPTVTPGVRGSHVVIAYDPISNETSMSVNEGQIDVVPAGSTSTISLMPGEQAIAGANDFATSSIADWNSVTNTYSLPSERTDATPDEIVHDAPAIPVDTEAETQPTRDALVGDLSDIDTQFSKNVPWVWLILIVLIVGGGAWFWRKKKLHELQNKQ